MLATWHSLFCARQGNWLSLAWAFLSVCLFVCSSLTDVACERQSLVENAEQVLQNQALVISQDSSFVDQTKSMNLSRSSNDGTHEPISGNIFWFSIATAVVIFLLASKNADPNSNAQASHKCFPCPSRSARLTYFIPAWCNDERKLHPLPGGLSKVRFCTVFQCFVIYFVLSGNCKRNIF